MAINWNEPVFGEDEIRIVTAVLKSGYVSEGPKTKGLEEKLAKIVGTKHVIMTTSCTAALYLAIEADKRIRGYNSGRVAIPALTFVGTKNAVEMAGLNTEIHDVNKWRFLMNDIDLSGEKIIIPVSLLGRQTKDIIAYHDHGYDRPTVICDNAGSLGSKVDNGKVGCYSLQGNKIISCGQGGFCATDSDEYAKEIRKLKDFGREHKEDNRSEGFNLKFNDILAAVTLGQLEGLEGRKQYAMEQFAAYFSYLDILNAKMIEYKTDEIPLWIEFMAEGCRDELFKYLKGNGINCKKPWKPLVDLENSKYYSDNCIWLPNGRNVGFGDIQKVCETIKEYYKCNIKPKPKMKLKVVSEDERGKITIVDGMLPDNKEFTILTIKKGKARGGCIHKDHHEYFTVIKGRMNVYIGNGQELYCQGMSGSIGKSEAHAFVAIDDTVVIEWGVPKSDKDNYDPEMRAMVNKINSK